MASERHRIDESLPFITLTGLDERTPIEHLASYEAEFAILYSATPEGRNRYPQRAWIAQTVRRLPRVAIHICGRQARYQLAVGELNDLVDRAGRIQVNGTVTPAELIALCARYPHHTIITQHNDLNAQLVDVGPVNHVLLQDGSGGQGKAPAAWLPAPAAKRLGYAGGLGPDNLIAQLRAIRAVASTGWWVDMESFLRTPEDWFDIDRAAAAVAAFKAGLAQP